MNKILLLDAHGQPMKWCGWQDAVTYHAKGLVSWSLGENESTFHGGNNRITGEQSIIKTSSIIAIKGEIARKKAFRAPMLNNTELFRRDHHLCAYCGKKFGDNSLSRDHVHPRSKGGLDVWENVVTACHRCNQRKDDKTLKEARMELLYVPYIPSRIEYLILANRNVLFDQMQFLLTFIPDTSPLKREIIKGNPRLV